MGRDRAGNVTYAADATETPLADTRVWLHMYEGASGLEYSFCRRTGAAHYMYDFTGFQQWRVERNALLSDEAKCLMFRLWRSDAALWSDTALARHFGVRVQRALAIVKIKAEEFGHVRAPPLQRARPRHHAPAPTSAPRECRRTCAWRR